MSPVVPSGAASASSQLLGWVGLLIVALCTCCLAYRRSQLSFVLVVAFLARSGAVLVHYYVAPLPDGVADAVTFESTAWQWSKGGFGAALAHYPGIDAYFYAWLMSLLYSTSGRSLLLLQSLSVLAGVLGVLATWHLAREAWGDKVGRNAAWVMALFPTVVMYGALPMREAYFVLFLVLGFIGAARWARGGGMWPTALALAGFGAATFFHGGAFVAILAFLGLIAGRSARDWLFGLAQARVRLVATMVLAGVLGIGAMYATSGVSIHKLGTAEELVSPGRWLHYFGTRVYGDARYPAWTQPGSPEELVWAVPLRAVYLLFSPFPWDVREPAHLIGLLDGLLYFTLTVLIWRGRHAIWQEPGARTLLLLTVPLVLAFGVGTGNFGTGLRHRAKFVAALVVLASVRLVPLVIRKGARYVRQTSAGGDLTVVRS